MKNSFKKIISICLILSMIISINVLATETAGNAATVTNTVEEIAQAYTLASCTVGRGSITSGTSSKLDFEDQEVIELSSDTTNAISVNATFTVPTQPALVKALSISVGSKATADVQAELCLYNYQTNQFDSIKTISVNNEFSSNSVEINAPASYLSNDILTMKLETVHTSSIRLSLDDILVVGTYSSASSKSMIHSYNVISTIVETGTESTDTSSANLKDRDNLNYSVASVGNKVAWNTCLIVDEPKRGVKTIQLAYAGKNSVTANCIWISMYRFDTKNWEVVSQADGGTAATMKNIVISNQNKIQSYLSDNGEIKVRLYNSATAAFTRDTDYLNLTIYSESENNLKKYYSDSVINETGTIMSGNEISLQQKDSDYLKMQSDSTKKVAVQSKFNLDVAKEKIYTLSVSMNTKVNSTANNQYISLLNYTTQKFTVFRTSSPSTTDETLRFSITDPAELDRYISSDGEVTLRIYNSASQAFVRDIDYTEVLAEYGDFESFEIAQISDIHELTGSSNFKSIINELNTTVNPDFTIITGDISDHGTPEQYAKYLEDKELFTNPVYTTPGNHDVRWWNANGKKDFTNKIGPLYQSFDYKGVHFVLLDSTVNLELDGKINNAQLEWLKDDLAAIPKDMPVIMFAHHPFKINNNITARHELLDAVKGYNVIAYMSGHVHYYGNVVEDGVPVNYITYVKDNMEQDYVTIKFNGRNYYIYKHKASDGSKELWLTGTMKNTRKTRFNIEPVTVDENGNVTVTATVTFAPDGVSSVKARLDNYGSYTMLTKNGSNSWSGTIDISEYTPSIPYGKHFVGVEVYDNLQGKWTDYLDYDWEGGAVSTNWVYETGDTIQSAATVLNGKVYVGSNDGKLYCINNSTGQTQWTFTCGDSVISKPTAYGNNVLFGSNDKKLYSLNAETGALNWSFTTEGSVISNPLINGDVVVFGSGDCKIYALNASSGAKLWSYQTNGLMRQQPIVSNGTLYAFVRDTYIWYAINMTDGSLKWRGNANTDESLFVCGDVHPVIAGNKLWCIDAQNTRPGYLNMETGVLEWFSTTIQNVSSRGPATDGNLVFYVGNSGRNVYAFNASDNTLAWTTDLRYGSTDGDLQQMQIDSGLIYQNGILYHVAERGRISGINPETGAVLFIYDAAGYPERVFWSTPEVSENTIYASGIDGKLYSVSYN